MKNLFFLLVFALTAFDSHASLINFDGLYNGGTYNVTNYGSTAVVTVSYQSLYIDGSQYDASASTWNNGYSNLNSAIYSDYYAGLLAITLTANNPAANVTLNSFEVGGYYQTNQTANVLEVVNGSNPADVLLNYATSPVTISGATEQTFAPAITGNSLEIILGSTWDLGVNNISYTYTATPIPGALWLAGSALAGLIGLGRRKMPV